MPNKLRETWVRQTTPGTLLLLGLAAIMFGPRAVDTVRGEPFIEAKLTLTLNRTGEYGIEEHIKTDDLVVGLETVRVEDGGGGLICRSQIRDFWDGERKQYWPFHVFTGCDVPAEAFRVCASFSIRSEAGRQRQFPPSCTSLTTPATKESNT